MDIVSPKTRSRMMSGIRGRNTQPELYVRSLLHHSGFRFRLHRRDLQGCPDIVMPKYKAIIFIHGCFWHLHQGCKYVKMPSSSIKFWTEKLNGNRQRDLQNIDHLLSTGWRVLIVWECTIRANHGSELAEEIALWIHSSEKFAELPKSRN
jgi:DNA mismatch endonuclease (patch repair protein)